MKDHQGRAKIRELEVMVDDLKHRIYQLERKTKLFVHTPKYPSSAHAYSLPEVIQAICTQLNIRLEHIFGTPPRLSVVDTTPCPVKRGRRGN